MSSMVATSHLWPLDTWTCATECHVISFWLVEFKIVTYSLQLGESQPLTKTSLSWEPPRVQQSGLDGFVIFMRHTGWDNVRNTLALIWMQPHLLFGHHGMWTSVSSFLSESRQSESSPQGSLEALVGTGCLSPLVTPPLRDEQTLWAVVDYSAVQPTLPIPTPLLLGLHWNHSVLSPTSMFLPIASLLSCLPSFLILSLPLSLSYYLHAATEHVKCDLCDSAPDVFYLFKF